MWEGGPNLSASSTGIVDLSCIPEVQFGRNYRLGAHARTGTDVTDDRWNPVQFDSEIVGVWRCSGVPIRSKVRFEGYEEFQVDQGSAEFGAPVGMD